MATGTIKRNAELKRRVFSFNKTAPANTQVAFTLEARELSLAIGEYVLLCAVHQAGNSIQPCYISYTLAKNVAEANGDVMISGYVFNPSNTDRTYGLVGMALVKA